MRYDVLNPSQMALPPLHTRDQDHYAQAVMRAGLNVCRQEGLPITWWNHVVFGWDFLSMVKQEIYSLSISLSRKHLIFQRFLSDVKISNKMLPEGVDVLHGCMYSLYQNSGNRLHESDWKTLAGGVNGGWAPYIEGDTIIADP